MRKLAGIISEKYLNGGAALVLMGIQWLYLWIFPWYGAYAADPRWGHNYIEAIAFLTVGSAYYSRSLTSYILAFLSALLVIPAALEFEIYPAAIFASAVLLALAILELVIPRKKQADLALSLDPGLLARLLREKKHFSYRVIAPVAVCHSTARLWLLRHLQNLSYLMLAHISIIYFLVRLPRGTYETDPETVVFNAMLLPFVFFLFLENKLKLSYGAFTSQLSFFWGMLLMLVQLAMLFHKPETWPTLVFTVAVTLVAVAALAMKRRQAV